MNLETTKNITEETLHEIENNLTGYFEVILEGITEKKDDSS